LDLKGHPDENILGSAKRLNRVVLTTDKDFWNDKKHPLQNCIGVFCIDAGPQDTDHVYQSFALLNYNLARFISKEFWHKSKALLKSHSFTIKQLTAWGAITETEYEFVRSKVFIREIR
jgi:predicted nuclease of predicted toxin-antitoxin system